MVRPRRETHPEAVFAVGDFRIGDRGAPGRALPPLVVEAFELIEQAAGLRLAVAQGGDLQRQGVLVVFQADRIRTDDALAQRRVAAPDSDFLVKQREIGDVDGRHVVGLAAEERLGVEGDQPLDTAEIDGPVRGFVPRLVVELIAQQTVGHGVDLPDTARPGIEQRQPPVGRDPEIAAVVLDDLENDIAGHSVGGGVADEGVPGGVEAAEARTLGGEPYPAAAVLENARDVVVGKRVGIVVIVQELRPNVVARVVTVDAVGGGPHPQIPVRILPDVADHLAAVDLRNVKETVRLAVVILESVHGSHVDAPAVGLVEGENIVAEQPPRLVVVVVFADAARPGVDHADAFREGAHPEVVPVQQQSVDVGELPARGEEAERTRRRIERVEPGILRADPEPPVAAGADFPHAAALKAVRIVGVVIFFEIGVPLGQVIDAPEERTDPQPALAVLAKRIHGVVGERIGIVRGAFQMLVTPGADVVDDDTRLGSDPQFLGRIRQDMAHEQRRIGVVRQPQAGNRSGDEVHLRHAALLQPEVHLVVVAQTDEGDDVLGINLPPVGVEERFHGPEQVLGAVKPAAVAGEPDDPVLIGSEAAQRLPRLVAAFDLTGLRIVAENVAVLHDDPDAALPVAVENRNGLGDRLPVGSVERHAGEMLRLGIVDIKPRVGADPDSVTVILDKTFDQAVPQSGRETGIVHEGLERFPVVTAQAVLRAEPHEAFVILNDRSDRILRQSVVNVQPVEMDRLRTERKNAATKRQDKRIKFSHTKFRLAEQI